VADGEIDPVVDETYPLEETGAAFAAMRDRDQVGKLVVRPQ
jgi:NADPH2:quinone reductase